MTVVPRESELKLDIDPDDLDRLRRHPLLESANGSADALTSVYYDTSDYALRTAGLSLRVRSSKGRHVQTIKRGGSATGMFARDEWERAIESNAPDLDAAAKTPLGSLLDRDGVRADLKPVFTIQVTRTVREVEHGGSAIEVALDEGTIAAGARVVPLYELECELKRGKVADLFDLARRLAGDTPLRLGTASKADRGYALLESAELKVTKASAVALQRGLPTSEAFQTIARACLRHLLLNEPVLLSAPQPDAIHQMRVALRRLRAALSLFKQVTIDAQVEVLKAELRWLTGELGRARDLDVQLARFRGLADELPQAKAGLYEICLGLERQRKQVYRSALDAVRSDRFRRLIFDSSNWIEAGGWLGSGDPALRDQPIEHFAAAELARRRRRVKKVGATLSHLDPHARHALRIRIKKLRYATEFLADVFDTKRARRRRKASLSALTTLQDKLGELNDIVVLQTQGDELVRLTRRRGSKQSNEEAAAALDIVATHQAAHAKALLDAAIDAYDEFADTKPFWKG